MEISSDIQRCEEIQKKKKLNFNINNLETIYDAIEMHDIDEEHFNNLKQLTHQFMRSIKKKIEIKKTICDIQKDINTKRKAKDNIKSDKKQNQGIFCTYICNVLCVVCLIYICNVLCVMCLIYIYTYICRHRWRYGKETMG